MSILSILKNVNKIKPPSCSAVIAAAGTSQRCKWEDKLFYRILGKPVLAHTLEVFQNCARISEIIVVAQQEQLETIGEMCLEYRFSKVSKIITGGATRPESVLNGIYAVSRKSQLIAVHDGARPCIDNDLLERTISAAARYYAAAPAVAITSTIKKVEDGLICDTVDRENLYEIQTPQIFKAQIIKSALASAVRKKVNITDDCMAAEMIGAPVRIVEGLRKNIKITDIEDLSIIEAFLSERERGNKCE